MSQLFASSGQSIEISASASVLPKNTQYWSPLGWTGWISLQSKRLSRVFSNIITGSLNFLSKFSVLFLKFYIWDKNWKIIWFVYGFNNHDVVITHLEPDILGCEVKWAFGSITTNKASGGGRIPVELFQILKDDVVKVLHSICQQIWKTQQWPQDQKRSVFIPIPKKCNAKEYSNYLTIALISNTNKVMLKILQARLQQYMNCELPDVQAGFRKGRGTRDQIANIRWIIKKAREFQKNIYFCFDDYTKAFDYVDHNKLENSLRDGNTRSPDLPLEKSVCRSGSNS